LEPAATEVYLDLQADVTLATFRPASRRLGWWVTGRWIFVVTIALLLATFALWTQEGLSTLVEIALWTASAGFIFLVLMLFVGPRARSRRALNEGHMRFVARDDGYFVEGPFGTQTFRWAIYKKAYIDKRFIYLLVTNRLAQVIPLQFVADPEPLLNHLRKLGLLRPTPRTFLIF
jgi:hypothetical protein